MSKENNKLKNILQQYRVDNLNNINQNKFMNNNTRNFYGYNNITNRSRKNNINNLLNVDNYVNKTMMYDYDRNNILNEEGISPNKYLFTDMNLTYQNNSIAPIKNTKKISHTSTKSNYLDNNLNQSMHNKTIDEFKDLLKKIDEKLYEDKI